MDSRDSNSAALRARARSGARGSLSDVLAPIPRIAWLVLFAFGCNSAAFAQGAIVSAEWWQNVAGMPYRAPVESEASLNARAQKAGSGALERLQNWQPYEAVKAHKALAIEVDAFANVLTSDVNHPIYIHVGYWGGGWEADSLEEAKAMALKNCKGECIIYMEEDNVVGLDTVVARYKTAEKEYLAEQQARLRKATVLDLIGNARAQLRQGVHSVRGALGNPTPNIGYPDHQQDYAAICQDRVFYVLKTVPQAQVNVLHGQLLLIAEAGLYGRFQRSVDTIKPYANAPAGRPTNTVMRFAYDS